MKELNFYVNRKKLTFDFVVCFIVTIVLAFLIEWNFFSEKLFRNSLFVFAILLFLYFFIHTIILYTRKKPLLTITSREIIIFRLFRKSINVKFDEIKSFQIISSYHRGLKTTSQIGIELKKPTERYSKTWFYKFMKLFGSRVANTQYGIMTTYLKTNENELLKILNERLKKS